MEITINGTEKEVAVLIKEIQTQGQLNYKEMHFDKEDTERLEDKFIELFVYCMSLQDEYNKPRVNEIREGLERVMTAKKIRPHQARWSVPEDLSPKCDSLTVSGCT